MFQIQNVVCTLTLKFGVHFKPKLGMQFKPKGRPSEWKNDNITYVTSFWEFVAISFEYLRCSF